MRIKKIEVENFRLLRDVVFGLEDRTTLIIGRNNSGKTSIAELFRRLLGEKSPNFKIEDFSLGCHECFWTAFEAFNAGTSAPDVVALLPSIKITIDITYDIDAPDLGPLSDCIVDLNPDCSDARLLLTYGARPTAPALLFTEVSVGNDVGVNRLNLFSGVRQPRAKPLTRYRWRRLIRMIRPIESRWSRKRSQPWSEAVSSMRSAASTTTRTASAMFSEKL